MATQVVRLNRCYTQTSLVRLFSSETLDLEKITKNNKVVVFIKGTPEEPRCGFSNAVVQIMRMHGVKYDSHDVLQNEALRQGNQFIYFSSAHLT